MRFLNFRKILTINHFVWPKLTQLYKPNVFGFYLIYFFPFLFHSAAAHQTHLSPFPSHLAGAPSCSQLVGRALKRPATSVPLQPQSRRTQTLPASFAASCLLRTTLTPFSAWLCASRIAASCETPLASPAPPRDSRRIPSLRRNSPGANQTP